MNDHRKKMIAPIVITVLFLLICVLYGWAYVTFAIPKPLKIVIVIVLIGMGVAMIYTLITRIKEIKGGEEDDLDNY